MSIATQYFGTADEQTRTVDSASPAAVSAADISNRIERIPISAWHVKVRILVGAATFFDAFDALTIAQVMPVLAVSWKLTGPQIAMLISIGYLGQLLGALFFGWLAERKGRVPAIIATIVTFSSMSIACALASDYDSLLVFRTIQGFGLGGEVPIAAAYISELTKAHGRGRFVLLYELIFSLGVITAGLVGYLLIPLLGWQYMFVIGAAPVLATYAIYRRLPESPRWLASQGRLQEADQALAEIERRVERETESPLLAVKPIACRSVAEGKTTSWGTLFNSFYLRRSLMVWSIWFGSYIVYYGIGTWLPTLYRTVFDLPLEVSLRYGLISNAVGFAGATLCATTIDYFGRRFWFAVSLGGSAVFLGVLWWLGARSPEDVVIFGSAAYFFATAAAVGVYLYTPELYPTRVRALGVATATAWLRLASILGPTIVGTAAVFGLGFVFLTFALIGLLATVIVTLFAVETKGAMLEELSP
jgi:MFS transporter, putative metabolite:H+ symporter